MGYRPQGRKELDTTERLHLLRASEALYIPDPEGRQAFPRAPETTGCQGGSSAEGGDQGEEAEVGGVGNSTGEGQSILQPSPGPERLRIVCSLGSPSRIWWWTGHLTLGVIEEHAHGVDPRPLLSLQSR